MDAFGGWLSDAVAWLVARTFGEVLLFLVVVGLVDLNRRASTLIEQLDSLQSQLRSLTDEADGRESAVRDAELWDEITGRREP